MKTFKKLLPIVILVLVLAILLVGYLVVKNYNENAESAEETTEGLSMSNLAIASSDDITGISFYNGDELLSFEKVNTTWEYTGNSDIPINYSTLSGLLNDICTISSRPVDDIDSSVCGFDAPANVVTLTTSSGDTITVTFGDINSFNSYQYMEYSTSDTVYFADSSVCSSFDVGLTDLIQRDTLPTDITEDLTNEVVISDELGNTRDVTDSSEISVVVPTITGIDPSSDDVIYPENGDKTAYGITDTSPSVKIDYSYAVESETETSSETTDDSSEETTVTQYIEEEYTIHFGSLHTYADSSGNEQSGYYYSPDGSKLVYTIDTGTYEALMDYINEIVVETETEETTSAS